MSRQNVSPKQPTSNDVHMHPLRCDTGKLGDWLKISELLESIKARTFPSQSGSEIDCFSMECGEPNHTLSKLPIRLR